MKRKNKKYFIVVVLLLLVGIGIGYAVLNTTLNITGKSSISKNTWDVHFENVQIIDGSVEAVKVPTIENSTTVDFEAQLNLPGDFYEFTVDVVNNGTIDALIESITKEPELTSDQKKYLNYIIEYQNGEQIALKQLVKANEFVRLKVRVELKKDIAASDLPEVVDVLNFGFTLNYIQSDGTGSSVTDNGVAKVKVVSGDVDTVGSEICIGTECFYVISSTTDTVTMLAKYNLYVGNSIDSDEDGEEIVTPLVNPTGKQNETALGCSGVRGEKFAIGTTFFRPEHSSDMGIYIGSIIEEYVNNYNAYVATQGVTPLEMRLLTQDEAYNLGCNEEGKNVYYCNNNAPSFIYSTSYWLGTLQDYDIAVDPGLLVYVIDRRGDNHFSRYYYDFCYGVRPVIVISKDYF